MTKELLKNCRNCGGKLVTQVEVEHHGERDPDTDEVIAPLVVKPTGDVLVCPVCFMANPKYAEDDTLDEAPAEAA